MTPKRITVHCSATKPDQNVTVDDIRKMHLKRGFNDIGYHIYIRRDGSVHAGRPEHLQGAQVKGHNKDNLGICLEGGINGQNKPEDNFTGEQYNALYGVLIDKCEQYNIPYTEVCGHRDWFPDLNGDGIIDKCDWLKDCPCFDVRTWFKKELKSNGVK